MDRALPASVIATTTASPPDAPPPKARDHHHPLAGPVGQPGVPAAFPASSPASVYADAPRAPASSGMASLNLLHNGLPAPAASAPASTASSMPAPYGNYAQSLGFPTNPVGSAAFPSSAAFPPASLGGAGAPSVLSGYPGGNDVLGPGVLGEPGPGVLDAQTGAWPDPHGLGGGGAPGGGRYRMQPGYGAPGANGLARGGQNGLLPPFGGRSMGMPNGGLHPSLGGHSVLGGLGGPLANLGGLPVQPLVPLGLTPPYGGPDDRYGPLDPMGAPLRAGGKRSAYDTPPYAMPGMAGVLPEFPGGALPDPTGFPALKEETSAACGPRRPRSRKRGNRPPGQPSIPVHLRNPKKGRARVFRKCMFCDKDNHIRRSVCFSCKQPLPAGKRRRDGNLSYQREHAAKQREIATGGAPTAGANPVVGPAGQFASTASTQAPARQTGGGINPPMNQARPADTGAN